MVLTSSLTYPSLVLLALAWWKYRDDSWTSSGPVWAMLIMAQLLIIAVTSAGELVLCAGVISWLSVALTRPAASAVTYALDWPTVPVVATYVLTLLVSSLVVRWAYNGCVACGPLEWLCGAVGQGASSSPVVGECVCCRFSLSRSWRYFGGAVVMFVAVVSALSGIISTGSVARIQAFTISWACVVAMLVVTAVSQLASRDGSYSRFSPTVFPVFKVPSLGACG